MRTMMRTGRATTGKIRMLLRSGAPSTARMMGRSKRSRTDQDDCARVQGVCCGPDAHGQRCCRVWTGLDKAEVNAGRMVLQTSGLLRGPQVHTMVRESLCSQADVAALSHKAEYALEYALEARVCAQVDLPMQFTTFTQAF